MAKLGDMSKGSLAIKHCDCLCEASLWTTWKYRGHLWADCNSSLLTLNREKFANVVLENVAICTLAVRYARQCVWHLNNSENPVSDLYSCELPDDGSCSSARKMTNDHLMFLSHYKVEAGTEATLIMEGMERLIREDPFNAASSFHLPVFVDSEGLEDLNTLRDHVKRSHYLVILLTPSLFSRPWCVIELVIALRSGVHILPVEIQRPGLQFQYPDDAFYDLLGRGEGLSDVDKQLLFAEDIALTDFVEAVRHVFMKIARPFSPHKSASVRMAELTDILRHCPVLSPEDRQKGGHGSHIGSPTLSPYPRASGTQAHRSSSQSSTGSQRLPCSNWSAESFVSPVVSETETLASLALDYC